MLLFKTETQIVIANEQEFYALDEGWDEIVNQKDLHGYLTRSIARGKKLSDWSDSPKAPIGHQEVWAAGVTYRKSKDARMEESKASGGASFYDKVYDAERPELFFKAIAQRVAGPGEPVHIRRDSAWNVPEPELTLFINRFGSIQGYTIGNDMSSRSIEGENPLYLPQAKTYDRSAALGPCLYVPAKSISPDTLIRMQIQRNGTEVFSDEAPISRMKRTHEELAGYLFRECEFPYGCFLMTGTCVVPGNEFTLKKGDIIHIQIDNIGTLTNTVSLKGQ